jgi:hypothetical protein
LSVLRTRWFSSLAALVEESRGFGCDLILISFDQRPRLEDRDRASKPEVIAVDVEKTIQFQPFDPAESSRVILSLLVPLATCIEDRSSSSGSARG